MIEEIVKGRAVAQAEKEWRDLAKRVSVLFLQADQDLAPGQGSVGRCLQLQVCGDGAELRPQPFYGGDLGLREGRGRHLDIQGGLRELGNLWRAHRCEGLMRKHAAKIADFCEDKDGS